MPIRRSHGTTYPEPHRIRARADGIETDLPSPPDAGAAAPERDRSTGRFVPGNAAGRRRKAKALAKVVGIEPEKVAPWLRPFVAGGTTYATDLISALPVQAPELCALAMDAAGAAMVARALLALGAAGDMKALSEARAWMREHRQSVISLRGLTAETKPQAEQRDPMADALATVDEEMQANEADQEEDDRHQAAPREP